MIEKARSEKSSSFLRELESALFLINDEEVLEKISLAKEEVLEKRANPFSRFTGEKDLKRYILLYLKSLEEEVKTVNIWCRTLKYDYKSIKELREKIFLEFKLHDIQGVCELHLQDRELFSPHLQFVGTKADLAEELLAKIVVDFSYELSLAEAKSLKEEKFYELEKKEIKVKKIKKNKLLFDEFDIDFSEELDKELRKEREDIFLNIQALKEEIFNNKGRK